MPRFGSCRADGRDGTVDCQRRSPEARSYLDSSLPWDIVYYRQADDRVPVDEFLAGCPVKVRARLLAVLDDVAEAPPPQFSGGGRWEAMHGTMRGYFEVRIQGPGRRRSG